MKRETAPLKVWVIVGVVITCIFLISYFLSNFSIERKGSRKNFETIDEKIQPSKTKKKKILVFGSSRMASALQDELFLSEQISLLNDLNVELKVVTTPNAELEHLLDNIDVYKMIRVYNPSVIIIQDNLLVYDKRKSSVGGKMGKHFFRKALEGKRGGRNLKEYKPSEDRWDPKLDSAKIDHRKFQFEKASFRKVPFEGNVDFILKSLIKSGAELIAIEVPYARKIMDRKSKLGKDLIENESLLKLSEIYGIEYWDNKSSYFFQDYHDFTHFNGQGKERYSKWFINNVSEYLKK